MPDADNSRNKQDQNSASNSREERSQRADVGEAAEQNRGDQDRAGQEGGRGTKQGSQRQDPPATTNAEQPRQKRTTM